MGTDSNSLCCGCCGNPSYMSGQWSGCHYYYHAEKDWLVDVSIHFLTLRCRLWRYDILLIRRGETQFRAVWGCYFKHIHRLSGGSSNCNHINHHWFYLDQTTTLEARNEHERLAQVSRFNHLGKSESLIWLICIHSIGTCCNCFKCDG